MIFHFDTENKTTLILGSILVIMGYFVDKDYVEMAGNILKPVFYSLGIATFCFAIYDWFMLQHRHRQWAKGGYKKEEMAQYRIK